MQARAKLPKKRRRVVNVDLPQAGNAGRRGRGGAGGKGKLNQKMGESETKGGKTAFHVPTLKKGCDDELHNLLLLSPVEIAAAN